jgi:hypothetical protein
MPTVSVREIHGPVKSATVNEMREAVKDRLSDCMAVWTTYHG